MKTTIFSTFFIAFIATFPSFSQDFWTPLNGPNGIEIGKVAATDDDQVFIQGFYQYILRSQDGGETWEDFTAGITSSYPTYVENLVAGVNGRAYLTNFNNLYRLNDQGTGWMPMNQPPGFFGVETMSLNAQGKLYLSNTNGTVYRLADNGQTYELIVDQSQWGGWMRKFYLFGGDNNFALMTSGAQDLIYQFSEDGSNVTLIDSVYSLDGLVYHPAGVLFVAEDIFKKSTDGGTTWQTINLDPGSSWPPSVEHISLSPSGKIFAGTYSGIYVSEDAGNTWVKLGAPLDYQNAYQMAITFGAGSIYSCFNYCGQAMFLRSTDDGETWEHLESKFTRPTVDFIYTDNASNIYARSCNSPLLDKSQDGGNTWSPFLVNSGAYGVLDIRKNSQGHLFIITSDYFLLRSTDEGVTWSDITPPGSFPYPNTLGVNQQDEIYIFDIDFVYKSADNGETWESYFSNFFDEIIDVAFQSADTIYVSGIFGYLNRSLDGGQTWEILVDMPDVEFIEINAKGHIYFVGSEFTNSGIYVSYDNLASWQVVLPGIYGNIASDLEGDVFIASYNGIYYSEDDGVTWDTLNEGIRNPAHSFALHIDDNQYLYCSNNYDVIYKSTEQVAQSNLVLGKVWFDANENCQQDAGEIPLSGWLVNTAGTAGQKFRSTNAIGNYIVSLLPGNYEVSPVIPNALWDASCNISENISFSAGMDTAFVDFPISASVFCPLLNVDISTTLLRRCFSNNYSVQYCNNGCWLQAVL